MWLGAKYCHVYHKNDLSNHAEYESHFSLLIEAARHIHNSIFRVYSLDMACGLIVRAIFIRGLFLDNIFRSRFAK